MKVWSTTVPGAERLQFEQVDNKVFVTCPDCGMVLQFNTLAPTGTLDEFVRGFRHYETCKGKSRKKR